eukprot:gene25801-28_t
MTQNGPKTALNCPQTSATSEVPCRPRCPQNTLDFDALPRFGSHRCVRDAKEIGEKKMYDYKNWTEQQERIEQAEKERRQREHEAEGAKKAKRITNTETGPTIEV